MEIRSSENEELNLSEIYKIVYERKLLIIFITFLFSVSAVFFSLSLENKYTSSSKLIISDNFVQNNSLNSQFGDIASVAGISIPEYQDDSSTVLAKLESLDFVMNLINNNNEIVPKIIAPKKYDSDKRTIIIDPKEYDSANKIWIRKPPAPLKVIPSYQEVHKEFRKIVSIDYDKKTAIFDISVEHISPIFAFELLSMIINEFNQLEQNKDINEAEKAISYLQEQAAQITVNDINKNINELIEIHLNTLMTAEISDFYKLEPISLPFIPEEKSWPPRAMICIIAFILGLFVSTFYVLGSSFLRQSY